ncbi:MAG: hypothetical protein WA704_28625, partial [Pseudolabrys sp.]
TVRYWHLADLCAANVCFRPDMPVHIVCIRAKKQSSRGSMVTHIIDDNDFMSIFDSPYLVFATALVVQALAAYAGDLFQKKKGGLSETRNGKTLIFYGRPR